MLRAICVLVTCLATLSCGPLDTTYRRRIMTLAPERLGCPSKEISLSHLGEPNWHAYSARGCGKRQDYVCSPLSTGDFKCDAMGEPPSPPEPQNPSGAGGEHPPQPPGRDGDQGGQHDHVESAWIDDSGVGDESQVDMMLFVVGLNHQAGQCLNCGVDPLGMQHLATAIHQAWPSDPKRIVIISSSFRAPCVPVCNIPTTEPAPPDFLVDELRRLYGADQRFQLTEVQANETDPHWGTLGIISGSRWTPGAGKFRQLDHSGAAEVLMRDEVTGLSFPIFAVHTSLNHLWNVADIKTAARVAVDRVSTERKRGIRVAAPIIAGDFNFTADQLTGTQPDDLAPYSVQLSAAEKFFHERLLWANYEVPASSVAGLPNGVFHTQNGNVMQALMGKIRSSDDTLSSVCAEAELYPVRISYSRDVRGNLARRFERIENGTVTEFRYAYNEGITLPGIAHNVIALGMKFRQRTDALPASCSQTPSCPNNERWCSCDGKCSRPDKCGPCPKRCATGEKWCECTKSCLNPTLCKKREDEDGACVLPP